jgi:uncharacterized protein YndB with AHSA1/START domain
MTEPRVSVLSERSFSVEHEFRAPAPRVFAAFTDASVVPHWWAPPGGSLRVETMDVRPGGQYRYVQRTRDGQELTFRGSYLEVRPPSRLVYTFVIEGQANEVTTTVDLEEAGGVTHVRMTNVCATKEVRDAMVKFGAEAGARAALAGLEGYLSRSGPSPG